ncbi:preprotein translocase subunit SecE [Anaerosphaera aminiphila DSM 21120]|uniref:Protein translocase subunit SecE n=1 Tax=Anaerosphaera aminiphila DSM 21120 TaxID=1120995 RepID=A0A1M5RX40_9FIRM|nr:preprotein translocase subunit SecE [Anaerosphaera aminiphila]SHH30912.1 preprotein translocase subunit SecE [Anaerosphaera aminiphila DSM 21120]
MAAKDSVKKAEEKKSFSKYFRGVKSEFKKVVWPTKKQILNYTLIVIVACILFALLLTLFDKLVTFVLSFIYG